MCVCVCVVEVQVDACVRSFFCFERTHERASDDTHTMQACAIDYTTRLHFLCIFDDFALLNFEDAVEVLAAPRATYRRR